MYLSAISPKLSPSSNARLRLNVVFCCPSSPRTPPSSSSPRPPPSLYFVAHVPPPTIPWTPSFAFFVVNAARLPTSRCECRRRFIQSSVLLDVKPWDDETDMKKLEETVRSVQLEGLLWGASKPLSLLDTLNQLVNMSRVLILQPSTKSLADRPEHSIITTIFYIKMKGDYYRYLAEIKTGDDRNEAADESLKAYEAATRIAEAELSKLPQYLYNGGFCRNGGIIGITQPRRVAAMTFTKRVTEECGLPLGQKVGYAIRFEDETSNSTRIKYMTDGLLLREALLDPYLSKYSVILVDEAHERTVHTDVLLGLLKTVQKTRSQGVSNAVNNLDGHKFSPLKLIIMSASLDAQKFSEYFGGARSLGLCMSRADNIPGRAGREGPGKCYRLYPEYEFYKLKDSTTPEIKRCNLSNVILQLKALGIDDILGFDFIEEPDRMAIIKSMELLFLLGALTDGSKLSDPVGRQMARLPLDPIYSKALIVASEFNCLEEMLIIVTMLSVESIHYAPREKLEESRTALRSFSSPEGDHLTLLNIYRASEELLEKSKQGTSEEKAQKKLRKWFNRLDVCLNKYSRTALRSFSSPEGDHLTLLNIYRASEELLEKSKQGTKMRDEGIVGKKYFLE
ncbi:hypothetical protein ACS0TY_034107 [Phlomoides rotata]